MKEFVSGDQFHEPREDGAEKREAGSAEMIWLINEFPKLKDERFEIVRDEHFEGGAFEFPDLEGGAMTIQIMAGGADRFALLKRSREDGVRAMSESLGIPFEQVDGETIRRFILFHEAGHVYDFLSNFASDDEGSDLRSAVEEWQINSQSQLDSLPLPGLSPADLQEEIVSAGGFEAWRRQNEKHDARCREMKISSVEDLFRIQEIAYRQLDKERYADRFAAAACAKLKTSGTEASSDAEDASE